MINRLFKNKDVFAQTQARLTLLYVGLLSLFLAVFVVVVYWLLSLVIYNEQKKELLSFLDQSTNVIEKQMKDNRQAEEIDLNDRNLLGFGNDQFFYYLIGADGALIAGKEVFPVLRPELLELVKNWKPGNNEVSYETITTDAASADGMPEDRPPAGKLSLMIAGKPVLTGQGSSSIFYVAKNISQQHSLFQWLLCILIGVAASFTIVAFLIGRYMSHRAMLPIAESYERQRTFTADASHELRTPLSVLMMSINALELEPPVHTVRDNTSGAARSGKGAGDDNDFVSKTLATMKDEVKRMTRLVGDLLLLARSDASELELEHKMFDFRPIAEKTVRSMETLAAARSIRLELEAPNRTMMRGDAERMKQVLYILLDNAIKFSPEGERIIIQLSASPSERRGLFRLTVQDKGPGIKAADAARIFDRFYRTDKVRTRRTSGHGLGLAIAKQIVEAHDGKIGVWPEVGKGSTFYVMIPVAYK
ncbi:HAMP domain-containing sensor histidine kinase [Paenibacillus algorifonticola]|uniref:sensor histidine kinase n=1 Tax=Paenibacillus algorifonticola TaxID=684063 RepID=UPI003D27ACE3